MLGVQVLLVRVPRLVDAVAACHGGFRLLGDPCIFKLVNSLEGVSLDHRGIQVIILNEGSSLPGHLPRGANPRLPFDAWQLVVAGTDPSLAFQCRTLLALIPLVHYMCHQSAVRLLCSGLDLNSFLIQTALDPRVLRIDIVHVGHLEDLFIGVLEDVS